MYSEPKVHENPADKIDCMTPLIAPSLLAADFARLGEEVEDVLEAGADLIHFDVMDNHYVPNLTIGPMVLRSLKTSCPNARFDVHLMVSPVEDLIEAFLDAGADYISIHPEATDHPHAALARIQKGGALAGVVLNPSTGPSALDYVIDVTDFVLVMSVNPGFGGQKFLPASLQKVSEIRDKLHPANPQVRIEIDGGINLDNIGAAHAAGASMFVAGTAIFGTDDYRATISAMRAQLAAT